MKALDRLRRSFQRLGAPALVVVVAALALCGVGLLVAASVASTSDALSGTATRQAMRLAIAVPAVALAFLVKPRWVRANAYVFFAFTIALLVLVLFVGRVTNGARRWLDVPGIDFKLQPSDLAKLALGLVLARALAVRRRVESWGGIVAAGALAALPAVLILRGPDLGTALSLVPPTFAVLFVAGARRSHLALCALGLALAVVFLIAFGLRGYQLDRIDTWWRQDSLSAAEKQTQGYHLTRSKIAIGSGGFFGYGFGEGPQNQRDLLPERQTDFVFAVLSEEFGFVGANLVLLLQLAIPIGLLAAALRVREPFARLAVVAIGVQIGSQALLNIGVATGAFPMTGIALPLISSGGSSALVTLVGIALALNLASHAEPEFGGEEFERYEEETQLERSGPRRWRA